MKATALAILSVGLLSCSKPPPTIAVDECLQQRIFRECMDLSKPGQMGAAKSCGQIAYNRAHTDWDSIEPKCSWQKRVYLKENP
jgi:hypothetical protein